MDDVNEKLIGYKPILEYQDDYASELNYNDTIDDNGSNNSNDNEINNDEIQDIINDFNNIGNLIDKLPNNVSDIIDEVYDQVLDFIEEELSDKEYSDVPSNDWVYSDDDDEEDNNSEDDDNSNEEVDDIWNDDDFFPIEKNEYDEDEIIEKEYVKNLVDLFTDYGTNLQNILSNFWTNFFIACNNKSKSEIKILLNNILLNSSDIDDNSKHLLDSAVTQNIIKSMKIDYYNMMFNAEETIKRLKHLKAVYELRLRYSKIEKTDGSTKTNQMNNNLLTAIKMTYERKYDAAYENLYRYLTSSNRVLNDTLQTWIQELKSKQILIEKKGIL